MEECVFFNLWYPHGLVDSIIFDFTKKYEEMNCSNPTEYVKEYIIRVVLPFKDEKSSETCVDNSQVLV